MLTQMVLWNTFRRFQDVNYYKEGIYMLHDISHLSTRHTYVCLSHVLTQNPVSALQLVGLFATAEVVDEVAKLVDVLQALGHHHFLMDQVRLRQIGASLDRVGMTQHNSYKYVNFFLQLILKEFLINFMTTNKSGSPSGLF